MLHRKQDNARRSKPNLVTESDHMPYVISKFIWSRTAALSICLVVPCPAVAADSSPASLDRGFQLLYNLDFDRAQEQFASYQQQHADDPMGPVAAAAALLFSELNRVGVLGTRFFDRDSSFRSRPMPKADPVLRDRLNSALQRAELLAGPHLASDPNDRRALLAMTLANGLRADYIALFEHRYRVALRYTRDATNYARQLLAICGDCYDAYIATGISRYLIGSLSAPTRWILRMGGSLKLHRDEDSRTRVSWIVHVPSAGVRTDRRLDSTRRAQHGRTGLGGSRSHRWEWQLGGTLG